MLTWDADAEPDARDFFVNQATPEGIGQTLTDEAARLMNGTRRVRDRHGRAERRESERVDRGDQEASRREVPEDDARRRFGRATTIGTRRSRRRRRFCAVHPSVKLIMAISAPAVPGAAEAVRQAGRRDVNVMGLSLPNMNKPYVHGGVVQTVVLWNTTNLGYLTVHAAAQAVRGTLVRRRGVAPRPVVSARSRCAAEILLGKPLIMNKANIDQFDF